MSLPWPSAHLPRNPPRPPRAGEPGPDGRSHRRTHKKAARKDGDYAVAWIRKEGQGRVFYCSLGHNGPDFQDSAILQFYRDGVQ